MEVHPVSKFHAQNTRSVAQDSISRLIEPAARNVGDGGGCTADGGKPQRCGVAVSLQAVKNIFAARRTKLPINVRPGNLSAFNGGRDRTAIGYEPVRNFVCEA